jgi:outer membrane protein assembly factor BamB
MRTRTMTVLATAVLALCAPVHAGDWSQWNGPKRDGRSDEMGLLKKWPNGGPKLLWSIDTAGTGYSAPAVVGGKVYTMGCRGDDEFVICLNDKGDEQWATKIGPVFYFKENQWSHGPNGTPTVDGDRLYAVGSQGILVCLDLAGKEKWRKDMPKDFAGEVNNVFGFVEKWGWGYCWSPLVDGDNVIITPGGPKGLVAALNKKTGEQKWRSESIPDQATYSSPIVADVDGVRQYIVMVQSGAVGVSAKDGSELWRFQRKNPFVDVVCPTPVYHDGHVFLTATKGPCHLVKLTKNGVKFDAKDVYSVAAGREMANDLGGVVLVDNHLYGANGDMWRCIDFLTGQRKWTTRELPRASVVYADGMLICVTQEEGEVVLVKLTPDEYTELSRFKLPKASAQRKPSGKVWTHPVIANAKLYLRDQELVFCYQIK